MTSERGEFSTVWVWRIWRGTQLYTCGAETQKAREPKDKLCRGTSSKWLEDERVNLADLWWCRRSAR